MRKTERMQAAKRIAIAVERNEVPAKMDERAFYAEGCMLRRNEQSGGYILTDKDNARYQIRVSRSKRSATAYTWEDWQAYKKADEALAAAATIEEAEAAFEFVKDAPKSLQNDIDEGIDRFVRERWNAGLDRGGEEPRAEAPEELTRMERYERLCAMEDRAGELGIEFEATSLCLWISGDTRPIKDELKRLGCRWSRKRKAWYWRVEERKAA